MRPTPPIPNHNLALAYVIRQQPLLSELMSVFVHGLILLQICVSGSARAQNLNSERKPPPKIRTEELELVSRSGLDEGVAEFWVTPSDRYRDRHFVIEVDRSVCQGTLRVNGNPVTGEDASEMFRFDRSNTVSVNGCLERVAIPLRVFVYPKVFLSAVRLSRNERNSILNVEATVRNTLLNSVTCTLSLAGETQELFLPPETSQTRSFSVRLTDRKEKTLQLELYKFEEAMAGASVHVRTIQTSEMPQ